MSVIRPIGESRLLQRPPYQITFKAIKRIRLFCCYETFSGKLSQKTILRIVGWIAVCADVIREDLYNVTLTLEDKA